MVGMSHVDSGYVGENSCVCNCVALGEDSVDDVVYFVEESQLMMWNLDSVVEALLGRCR